MFKSIIDDDLVATTHTQGDVKSMHYYKYDILKFSLPFQLEAVVQVNINQHLGAVGNTQVELKLLADLTSTDRAVFAKH